jgi:hypothetical protein
MWDKPLETIKTREDFYGFLQRLIEDFENNGKSWENRDLGSYFEALSAWISEYEGVYLNRGEAIPENISWQFFAQALLAATIYE